MNSRLFEFEDKTWLPEIIRESMTDYLRFVLNSGNFYEPVAGLIVDLLKNTSSKQVIDLGSGGGGTVEQIQKTIYNNYQINVNFILTDIFPNINAYQYIKKKTAGKIDYCSNPVNAATVDNSLKGMRTIFSAFHHFNGVIAKQVINDAVKAKEGIAIFDGGNKNLFFIIAITLLHPIAFVLFTPFFRPFKWRRLLFTYIIPIIPLCTMWDGMVSVTRLYTPQQLLVMAEEVNATEYTWKAGKKKNRFGMSIAYLLGYPNTKIL